MIGKREYRNRAWAIGLTPADLGRELGLGPNTWRNWIDIPEKAEYWLYWREAENRLDGVRKLLGVGDE